MPEIPWEAGAEKVQDGGQRRLHSETVSKLITIEEATLNTT